MTRPVQRALIALGLVMLCAPFLLGAAGSIIFVREAIGPLITFAIWMAMFVWHAARARGGIVVLEWFAIIGALVMLQLLLDLHTAHLGDLVIAALHVAFVVVGLVAHRRARRRRTDD